MAMVRMIYDSLRREGWAAFDYIKGHPRRMWIIGVDAILSIVLVCVGFSIASASSKTESSLALLRAGAVAMPSSQLASYVRSEGGTAYWLGDKLGFNNSTYQISEQSRSISYIEEGSDPRNLDIPEITIMTYRGTIDMSGFRHFGTWIESSTAVTASGLIVEYDLHSMMEEIVAINGTSNVVYVRYSTVQSLQTLLRNASSLKLVA